MAQNIVEALMLMSCKKDILMALDNEDIIDLDAVKSKYLTNLLIY